MTPPYAKISALRVGKTKGGAVLASISVTTKDGSRKTWVVAMAPGELEEARRRVEEWTAKTNAKVSAWEEMGGQAQSPSSSDAPLPPASNGKTASYDPDAPMPPTKTTFAKRMSMAELQTGMRRLIQDPSYKPSEAEFDTMSIRASQLGVPETAEALQDRKLSIYPDATRLSLKPLHKAKPKTVDPIAELKANMKRLASDPNYQPSESQLDDMTIAAYKLHGASAATNLQNIKVSRYPRSTMLSIKDLEPEKRKTAQQFHDPFEKLTVIHPGPSITERAIAALGKIPFLRRKSVTVQGKWLDSKSPGWSVMGVTVKDSTGQTKRVATHCIELPSGKLVPARIFHCPRGDAAAGACDGGPHYITNSEKQTVFGCHVKSRLLGKLRAKIAGEEEIEATEHGVSAPGDWATGPTDLHRAKFVDDALHEEQIAIFAEAGPHGMDMYREDAVFGVGGSAVPGVILPEIVGGVTKRIMRGEILDPSEVMDPTTNYENRLFEKIPKPPKKEHIRAYDYDGPPSILPPVQSMSSGRFEINGCHTCVGNSPEERALAKDEGQFVGYQHSIEIAGRRGPGLSPLTSRLSPVGIGAVTKQYVPSRDKKKLALWEQAKRALVYRHAMNAAWMRGSKNPTKAEIRTANLWAIKLMKKHGAPTSLAGNTIHGVAVVTPAMLGLDLYDLNPMSWFRSAEVNALYRAQIEAAERRKRAEKLQPLTAETKRRWDEVQQIEDGLKKDVEAIETAKKAQTRTALSGGKKPIPYILVGAWWWPLSKHRRIKAAIMKEADLIAPDPRTLPPLPQTAPQMPPEKAAALDPGPAPDEQEPPIEEAERQEMQQSAAAEADPESAETVDGMLGWPDPTEVKNAMVTLTCKMPADMMRRREEPAKM